jgi:hypothetical protein
LAQFIPHLDIPLLDIALRSGVYVLGFGILVLRFRVSPDLNEGLSVLRAKYF